MFSVDKVQFGSGDFTSQPKSANIVNFIYQGRSHPFTVDSGRRVVDRHEIRERA